MSNFRNFIRGHIEIYLRYSRMNSGNSQGSFVAAGETSHIPPNVQEVEDLIMYLRERGVEPIIVGSSAIAQHLKITELDIRNRSFRLTKDLDVFVSKDLPTPPNGWRRDAK